MNSLTLVIFGVTGNLAQNKLLPAIYNLSKNNMLPLDVKIIGISRSLNSTQEFKKYVASALKINIDNAFLRSLKFIQGDAKDINLYKSLKRSVSNKNRMFYLATYPELYETIVNNLNTAKLNREKDGFSRIMIEKPIGTNLKSAKKLNSVLLEFFKEDQIFRLDHYLGKETLQNIIDFRFGNGLFEPLINSQYVDHIQITSAEQFGIEKRAGYYDATGALKDIGQNHILQMIALATMEDPVSFTNEAITRERIKVLQSLKPLPESLVYGQYSGYKKEEGVLAHSATDTFFAFKTELKSKRFKGVPIYVRAGKMLQRTATEIAIVFKLPVNRIFKDLDCGLENNILIYRIQPNEGIVLKILSRAPGYEKKIVPSFMQFCYRDLPGEPKDAYENLIQNALEGDQTFFNDAPEIEAQWKFADKLIKRKKDIHVYKRGSWGPKASDKMIQKDGREWIVPSLEFCKR